MSSRVSHFQIGLFLLFSLALILAGLFWVGAVEFYQETRSYVTYIDSSVEGLSPGSRIRYRGLEVGRVAGIGLARDGELIRLDLEIRPDFRITKRHAAQIKLKGITGERYLALVRADPEIQRIQPPEGIEPERSLVPAIPGQMERVAQGLRKAYRQLRSADVQALTREWRTVAARTNELLATGEMNATLQRLNSLSAELDGLARDLSRAEPGEEWQSAMRELTRSAKSARELLGSLERRVEALSPQELAEIPVQTNDALIRIRETANATGLRVESTAALLQRSILELDRVLSEMRALVRTLERDPGRILTQPEKDKDPFGR